MSYSRLMQISSGKDKEEEGGGGGGGGETIVQSTYIARGFSKSKQKIECFDKR